MATLIDGLSSARLHDSFRRISTQCLDEPGIDLGLAAEDLKATIVDYRSGREAGCVTKDGSDRYLIRVDPSDSLRRRRFTIAHEIGHILFDLHGLSFEEQVKVPRVETLCNDFASRLLIPRRWLKSDPHISRVFSIGTIEEVARTACVSDIAAFVATAAVNGWSAACVVRMAWDSGDARWLSLYSATRSRPVVRPTIGIYASEKLGAPCGDVDHRMIALPFKINARTSLVRCEVKTFGSECTILADLRDVLRNSRKRRMDDASASNVGSQSPIGAEPPRRAAGRQR